MPRGQKHIKTTRRSKPFNRSPRNFTGDYVGDPYICAKIGANPSGNSELAGSSRKESRAVGTKSERRRRKVGALVGYKVVGV